MSEFAGKRYVVTGAASGIAGARVFLVSDATRWINGHPLIVDGGISGAVLAGLVPPPDI